MYMYSMVKMVKDYYIEEDIEYRVMDGAELEVYGDKGSAQMVVDILNAGIDLDKLREIVNKENFKYLHVLLD